MLKWSPVHILNNSPSPTSDNVVLTKDTQEGGSTTKLRRSSLFTGGNISSGEKNGNAPRKTSLSLYRSLSVPASTSTAGRSAKGFSFYNLFHPNHCQQLNPAQLTCNHHLLLNISLGTFHSISEGELDSFLHALQQLPTPPPSKSDLAHTFASLCYSDRYFNKEDLKKLGKIILVAGRVIPIKELSFKDCFHGSSDNLRLLLQLLYDARSSLGNLKKLTLTGMNLTSGDLKNLCKLLGGGTRRGGDGGSGTTWFTKLSELDLSGNRIGPKHIEGILQSLLKHPSLKMLNLSGNNITTAGTVYLAEFIRRQRSLTHLHLGGNHFHAAGASRIASALKLNSALTHLYLETNDIGPDGTQELALALSVNSMLTHLRLSHNQLFDDGVHRITKVLMERPDCSLKWLDLEFNQITEVGAGYLARVLRVQATRKKQGLKGLNLSNNALGDQGVLSISEALEFSPPLTHLRLSNCSLGPLSCKGLAQCLRRNVRLLHLDLCSNLQIESLEYQLDIAEAISQGDFGEIKGNSTIRSILLSYNYSGWDKVYDKVQDAVSRNYKLIGKRMKAAAKLSVLARIFFSPSVHPCRLPVEVLEKIWYLVDDANLVLTLEEIEGVQRWVHSSSSSAAKVKGSRLDFIRMCIPDHLEEFTNEGRLDLNRLVTEGSWGFS